MLKKIAIILYLREIAYLLAQYFQLYSSNHSGLVGLLSNHSVEQDIIRHQITLSAIDTIHVTNI